MNLPRDNWLVKLYKWNFDYLSTRWVVYDTNLCHFCRVVFFWVPFKVISGMSIISIATFSLLYFFFILVPDAGWAAHWIIWGIITSGFIFWYLADNYKTPAEMADSFGEAVENMIEAIPPTPKFITDFTVVVWEWVKGKKQKICPLIHIENDNK